MTERRSTKRCPRIVGVIASRDDLEQALRMRRPPDLFELRLDRLAGIVGRVETKLPKLRAPLIITARRPNEGGSGRLSLRQRRADIFKVATRTDTPTELGRLLEFITKNRVNVRLAVMGIGRLGAISRVLLARAGSVLIYASLGPATDVEGQPSLEQLRALGFG